MDHLSEDHRATLEQMSTLMTPAVVHQLLGAMQPADQVVWIENYQVQAASLNDQLASLNEREASIQAAGAKLELEQARLAAAYAELVSARAELSFLNTSLLASVIALTAERNQLLELVSSHAERPATDRQRPLKLDVPKYGGGPAEARPLVDAAEACCGCPVAHGRVPARRIFNLASRWPCS